MSFIALEAHPLGWSMVQFAYRLENSLYRVIPRTIFQPRWCYVFESSTETSVSRNSRLPSGFQIRWANATDIPRFVSVIGETLMADRLTQEDRSVILMQGDHLIGTIWVAKDHYSDWETGIELRLPEKTAWIYGSWIHRNFRGQGFYSKLWRFVAEQLRQEGIDRLRLTVDWSNGHSQRVHRTLGASIIGSMFGLRLFGRSYFRLPSAVLEAEAK